MPQSAADIYNTALAFNTQLYNSVNAGYSQVLAQQRADAAVVTAGYNRLLSSVLGKLEGSDAAARQQAKDLYTQASGREAQALTNRGLGNTTVASSVQRGLTADYGKAQTDITSQFAQLKANYESQLGLAGLQFQGNAIQQYASLGANQLQTAAGFAPTFAGLYSGLAQVKQQQDFFDRQQAMQILGMNMGNQAAAGAQGAQNWGRADALQQANDQLGFKYAQLGAEQQMAGGRLGLGYAQLNQQGQQFGANLNLAYDRSWGYGTGAPQAFSGQVGLPSNMQYAPSTKEE